MPRYSYSESQRLTWHFHPNQKSKEPALCYGHGSNQDSSKGLPRWPYKRGWLEIVEVNQSYLKELKAKYGENDGGLTESPMHSTKTTEKAILRDKADDAGGSKAHQKPKRSAKAKELAFNPTTSPNSASTPGNTACTPVGSIKSPGQVQGGKKKVGVSCRPRRQEPTTYYYRLRPEDRDAGDDGWRFLPYIRPGQAARAAREMRRKMRREMMEDWFRPEVQHLGRLLGDVLVRGQELERLYYPPGEVEGGVNGSIQGTSHPRPAGTRPDIRARRPSSYRTRTSRTGQSPHPLRPRPTGWSIAPRIAQSWTETDPTIAAIPVGRRALVAAGRDRDGRPYAQSQGIGRETRWGATEVTHIGRDDEQRGQRGDPCWGGQVEDGGEACICIFGVFHVKYGWQVITAHKTAKDLEWQVTGLYQPRVAGICYCQYHNICQAYLSLFMRQ